MVESDDCPVASAHHRLRDVHAYWHATADNYMEPDAFRRSLNSTVQELRNISWLVQKKKSTLPGFDTWYKEWQEEVRTEPVMRWIVDSRNAIVKQGDLDLLSTMHVRYHIDWEASSEMEMEFRPGTPLKAAALAILHRLDNPSLGFITTKRRWTDYRLPGVELLDALATSYGRCFDLIETAHRAAGPDRCSIRLATLGCPHDENPAECMQNASSWTEASIDASTREFNRLRHYVVKSDERLREESIAHYGACDDLPKIPQRSDALGAVDVYIEMGRRILAVDSDLMMQVVYFRDGKVVHLEGGKPEDHLGKVLWADHLADKALNVDATSLLISADIWEAQVTNSELDGLPVRDRPDRLEALSVMAVSRNGRSSSKRLRYTRRPDGGADFGELIVESKVGRMHYLEPLRMAWGLTEWRDVNDPGTA
jgi:hypothetical protein